MAEESKTAVVPVTIEQEVESFISHVMNDIMPTIDEPDPFLTVLGTLSILFNRIKMKNRLIEIIQEYQVQISMDDKYFNGRVFEQFRKVLDLPSEIATRESNDDRLMSIVDLSFIELMKIYLESVHCLVSVGNITMEQFDKIVAYQIDFVKLLE